MQDRGPAAYLAEFIGTFMLVLMITLAVSLFVTAPEPVAAGAPPAPLPFIDWSVIGFVHVFVLFLLIQSLAVASGAHFNPAVTTAMTVLRQIKPADAVIYIIVQLAAAVVATLVTKWLLTDFANAKAVDYGATSVSDQFLDGKRGLGMLAEFIGTFFLMWAIVSMAVSDRTPKDWAAFVIGGTLGAGVMVMGGLTGAGFNPARSFGPALVGDAFGKWYDFLLVYTLAPILGAIAAAAVYYFVYIAPGKKGPGGAEPVG